MKRVILCVLCVVLCLGLCSCGKSEAVKNVEAAISSIGTVTLDSEARILAAEKIYDALPAEEQEAVENYSQLKEARAKYNALSVEHVEALIDDIGEVTLDRADKITAARTEFDTLSGELQNKVHNVETLTQAEERLDALKTLDANMIKNYAEIDATKIDAFNTPARTWFEDESARATLFLCFLLQNLHNHIVDLEKTHMFEQFAGICSGDKRVDIYAPYGDDEIMGIQYWPSTGKAQIGTVKTELTIDAYLELLVQNGIIDDYKAISEDAITKVLRIITSLVN